MVENSFRKILTYSDYKSLYKSLADKKRSSKRGLKGLKIAILSSFTIQGLDEILFVKCFQQGIKSKIYLAPYNQYGQEIMNPKSKLYEFNPDLVILIIDPINFFGDYWLNPYQLSTPKRKKLIKLKFDEIKNLILRINSNAKAKVLIHNFNIPHYSPLGILENKQQFGFINSIRLLNVNLQEMSINNPNLFIFDYDAFCSMRGSNNTLDYKMYYLADMRLPTNYLAELCDEYLGYIKPLVSLTKKCLVLDLDNTLWGGILGEVGFSGIQLGPTPEGRSFWEFQKYILSIHQRGILLAINSRNNLDEVLKVLRKHPYMILREKHFSSIEANWQNKVTNMKSIAKQLNIGLDSFIYFDDDPYQRDLIRKKLKEITVVDLPEDKSLYLKTIINLNDFNTLQITNEDKNRGKMYIWERKRKELEKNVSNIDEFVKSLQVTIEIETANEHNIPRISQLSQKTNQFNVTTRRYLEDQIKIFHSSDRYIVLAANVKDKFGDYGLTGVVIIKKNFPDWIIDSFLLSCRILGRKIEESILAYLIKEAKNNKVQKLIGHFIKTEKNTPAKDFYRDNNFKFINKSGDIEEWEFNCKLNYRSPEHVKIIIKNKSYE